MASLTVWECDQCKARSEALADGREISAAGWHNVEFTDYWAGMRGHVILCPACFPIFVLAGLAAAVQV